MLKTTGASGVVHKGNGVQIIYGPRVTVVKSNLEDYLETAPDELYQPSAADTDQAAENKTGSMAEKKAEGKLIRSEIISSPVNGVAADLSEAPDEAFAGRMMGDGAIVIPEEPKVVAPEDGEVSFVFDTKHAIGFVTSSGTELLLHMGIDTVKLNGKGFEVLVKDGDKVKKGDLLMKLDLAYLAEHAPSLASPVLCTELSENQKIRLLKSGNIQAGEALFAIDTYEE